MLAIVNTLVLQGIEARVVKVEVDIHNGLPAFEIVGLASQSVREAKERVRAAIKNSGLVFPLQRITVNLAPADIKKEGTHFDLPIAVGILVASGQLTGQLPEDFYLVGELSLEGSLRKIPGVLPMALELMNIEAEAHLIIPSPNEKEAALVKEIRSYKLDSLLDFISFIEGEGGLVPVEPLSTASVGKRTYGEGLNFSDVKGQATAKRALEIAAAGYHNVLML